jgi:excinuclease ABC subunit C
MKKPCFNSQIGLCPGVCAGLMNKRDYRRRIKYIKLFFEAKKDLLIKDLEKEMQSLSKRELFEEAEKIKRTIYALDHIQDVALIKRDIERGDNQNSFRIEAYDIAHMSGQNTVGVMTVVIDGELAKDQYRKFKIIGQNKKINIDDTANLKEVIRRRLGHIEWPLPNLIVIDGSTAQINAARSILIERGFLIEIVAVVKDERHRAKEIVGLKHTINSWNKSIILANAEAHRFAITYHRKLRSKGFRI